MEDKGKTVLVAVDQSKESLYALQWALDNLVHKDDKIVLLHSQPIPYVYTMNPPPMFGSSGVQNTPEMIDSLRKHNEMISAALLSKAKELCDESHIKSTALVSEGDPRENICRAVDELNADVLVMGSHGYGVIKRTFMGSVSDHCAHHAKCPILIVKDHSTKDSKQ